MNKKVYRSMIALVVIFLCGLYILKGLFPERFIMIIENKNLILIGEFVDNNLWLHIILACITSFITYWLYFGAVLRKWVLCWRELLAILITIIVTQILYSFDETYSLASGIAIISMLLIPCMDGAALKDVAIVFSVHYMSQLLSTLIRNLPLLLTNINYATILLMGIESYFWLLLFYLYFNSKKGG